MAPQMSAHEIAEGYDITQRGNIARLVRQHLRLLCYIRGSLSAPERPRAIPGLGFACRRSDYRLENGVRSARLWRAMLCIENTVVEGVEFDGEARHRFSWPM